MDSHGRMPAFLMKKNNTEAKEEFEEALLEQLEEGQKKKLLNKRSFDMICNVLELDEVQAHDIMIRRNNITAIDQTTTLAAARDLMIEENKSRIPVFHEDLDDITGVLNLKEVVRYGRDPENLKKPVNQIAGLLQEAHFIPESKNIGILFHEMQVKKTHMVVVIDEYGQTAGLLTMEDILEEIVGNVFEENDKAEQDITKGRDGSYIIKGVTRLEDIEEVLAISFEEEDYETLNGFLIGMLDRIPSKQEKPEICYQGYRFHVQTIENNVIQKVKVTRISE